MVTQAEKSSLAKKAGQKPMPVMIQTPSMTLYKKNMANITMEQKLPELVKQETTDTNVNPG